VQLQSRIRYAAGATHRIVSPEETCRLIAPHMRRIGVTRIADTTGLDTIGMPIYSAIRPTDMGPDGISVYNGKGLTKADSRAGAMMEAVERYRAETWLGTVERGTYAQLQARHAGRSVMDPASMHIQQRLEYDPDVALEWVEGWDLLAGRSAMVPLNYVLCPFDGPGRGVWESSTNGLASGNCLEEAVCHALAEVIERDAYTIGIVRAQLVPRVERLLSGLLDPRDLDRLRESRTRDADRADAAVDDSVYPSIDLSTVPPEVRRLVRAAERDGSQLWLRDITSDIGIPTFVASMLRREPDGSEFAAGGFGCDANAAIAAIRAITETAQGRNVQIQGVREDAKAVKSTTMSAGGSLWCRDGADRIHFDEVDSYRNDDILDDIELMLGRLRSVGVQEAYAVDLTDPSIPANVARVIVPEMEAWFLRDFAADSCRLGWRALRYLAPTGDTAATVPTR
jgi:ribosomal protein S12 methylthiotransferase accessory factor